MWTGECMDFDALQARMVNAAATVRRRLASAQPASLVVFDVLAVGNVGVRPMRWTARRNRLEALAEAWRRSAATVSGDQRCRRGARVAGRVQGLRGRRPCGQGRYQPVPARPAGMGEGEFWCAGLVDGS